MYQVARAIHFIFLGYTVLLFVRILGSWFPNFQRHSAMRFVHFYTEPYLKFFRKVIPQIGMMDLSPLLALLALRFLEKIVFAIIW